MKNRYKSPLEIAKSIELLKSRQLHYRINAINPYTQKTFMSEYQKLNRNYLQLLKILKSFKE